MPAGTTKELVDLALNKAGAAAIEAKLTEFTVVQLMTIVKEIKDMMGDVDKCVRLLGGAGPAFRPECADLMAMETMPVILARNTRAHLLTHKYARTPNLTQAPDSSTVGL